MATWQGHAVAPATLNARRGVFRASSRNFSPATPELPGDDAIGRLADGTYGAFFEGQRSTTVSYTSTSLDLHYADSLGHQHTIHAVMIDGGGWQLDGCLFAKHCHDWQSVERTVTRLRLHGHEMTVGIPPRSAGIPALL